VDRIGASTLVNAGEAKQKRLALIRLDGDEIDVTLLAQ
jgi:Icc-related predicted phosphoesterase